MYENVRGQLEECKKAWTSVYLVLSYQVARDKCQGLSSLCHNGVFVNAAVNIELWILARFQINQVHIPAVNLIELAWACSAALNFGNKLMRSLRAKLNWCIKSQQTSECKKYRLSKSRCVKFQNGRPRMFI